ncbi:zinc ribbon domain-containing protein [candidate division KSB1 bacterium]|nr:zinc ribbon domain-containing protein [candidate division KSB1 bacterium]
MKCEQCGTENPNYATYCLQCGTRLPLPAPVAAPLSDGSGPRLPRGNGVMILIFGILSLSVCAPFGIIAWIMANNDLYKMQAGIISNEEAGLTRAGKILGIVGTVLFILTIVIMIAAFGFLMRFRHFHFPGMPV